MAVLTTNRKAWFDYTFLETYKAGISLLGSEVKAIKAGRTSIVDAFCYFANGELFLKNLIIQADDKFFQHDPNRDKKLLLKKKELKALERDLDKHLTIIPINIYTTDRNLIKCEIALAKGKKNYDKRQDIKERDLKKQLLKEYI